MNIRIRSGIHQSFIRSSKGITLTELLIGTLLIGGTLAVLAEFMTGLVMANAKLTNQFEGQMELRSAISRIRNDVRAARTIGDSYSTSVSTLFPGADNWLYQTPPSGGWPADWGPTPYQLNPQTLIVQVPAMYSGISGDGLNGFPMKIKNQSTVNGVNAPADMEDLDTVVYKIVQDSTNKSLYSLQVAMFPGLYNQGKAINPPQTLVKGIIGPTTSSNTGLPEVFSYVINSPNPTLSKNPGEPNSINGVRIDIEVKRPTKGAEGGAQFQKNTSAHAEVFTRWNRM